MSVQTTSNGPIAHITLDRPDKRNAFDDSVIEALIKAFTEIGSSDDTRVIVLDATGKHFSAGADLGWMRTMGALSQQENHADARRLAALMDAIDRAGKPVIARVQGAAFGGALGLICAADIAVAAEDARFCLSEVRLGILPAVIAPYVVRAMGARQARRYFLSAEVINAARAADLGIVHEVVPESELDAAVTRIAEALLNGAPEAQMAARELVSRASDSAIDTPLIEYTAELIARLRTGEEGQEGLSAFLEKRPAAWQTNGKHHG